MTETSFPNAAPARRLPHRRQIQLVALALVGVLAIFAGLPRLSALLFPPPPDAPAPPRDGTFTATDKQWRTLRFETVQTGSFQSAVTTDGLIASDDDRATTVYSPFTGRVTKIFASLGDHVRAGAPLFAVIASEAGQSEADMLTARAQLATAQAEEARLADLSQHQGAAIKDFQQSQLDVANAQGALVAAQARRAALGGGISHGEAVVRAPVSGIVTQRLIGLGQNIASAAGGGATQAFAIGDFSHVWVIGNLREEDAMQAHIGQAAQVALLADPAHPLAARLDYVAPMLDPASRRLTVRATLANPEGRLKPQMYASVRLITGPARRLLSVPSEAVIYEGPTARVWIALPASHRLALRPIATGQTLGDRVEVTGGLKDGDTVVTAGALFIDRGAKAD